MENVYMHKELYNTILKSLRLEKARALPGTYGLKDCRPPKHWYMIRTPYGSFIIDFYKAVDFKSIDISFDRPDEC